MRNTLAKLLTLLRHMWLPLVVIILLIVAGVGISATLHAVRPEPLWTNATKELAQRVKSEVTQSLDITLSRGEFINIDGPGGIVIGTITDHAARQRLLVSQPFRDCTFGCTGWMAYSRLGRTLPLDSRGAIRHLDTETYTDIRYSHDATIGRLSDVNNMFDRETLTLAPSLADIDAFVDGYLQTQAAGPSTHDNLDQLDIEDTIALARGDDIADFI